MKTDKADRVIALIYILLMTVLFLAGGVAASIAALQEPLMSHRILASVAAGIEFFVAGMFTLIAIDA